MKDIFHEHDTFTCFPNGTNETDIGIFIQVEDISIFTFSHFAERQLSLLSSTSSQFVCSFRHPQY